MLYLGIDQHGKRLTVNLRNEEGSAILKRQVSTEWKRVREFFDCLREEALAARSQSEVARGLGPAVER